MGKRHDIYDHVTYHQLIIMASFVFTHFCTASETLKQDPSTTSYNRLKSIQNKQKVLNKNNLILLEDTNQNQCILHISLGVTCSPLGSNYSGTLQRLKEKTKMKILST